MRDRKAKGPAPLCRSGTGSKKDNYQITENFNPRRPYLQELTRRLWQAGPHAAHEVLIAVDGVTPIERPAPRWSSYIHKLRKRYGIAIETVSEAHSGPFPGHHARYILRSRVELVSSAASGVAALSQGGPRNV